MQLRILFIIACLVLSLVGLSACGKKPAHVDPPVGATDLFPRTYPDIKLDPKAEPTQGDEE